MLVVHFIMNDITHVSSGIYKDIQKKLYENVPRLSDSTHSVVINHIIYASTYVHTKVYNTFLVSMFSCVFPCKIRALCPKSGKMGKNI